MWVLTVSTVTLKWKACHGNNKPTVTFSKENILKIGDKFPFSIKARFAKVPIAEIGKSLERGGFRDGFRVISISRFQVVIILKSESDFIRLLSRKTWRINGQQLFLSKWDPLLEDKRDSPLALVWVTLKNIPFFLANIHSLFSIVKSLGTPIQMDETTARGGYFNTARVLVEMDASKTHQTAILVRTPSWERDIHVIYDLPPFCLVCGRWGHCCKPLAKVSGKVLTGGAANERQGEDKKVTPNPNMHWVHVQRNGKTSAQKKLVSWNQPTCTKGQANMDKNGADTPGPSKRGSPLALISHRSQLSPKSNACSGDKPVLEQTHSSHGLSSSPKLQIHKATLIRSKGATNEHNSPLDYLALLSTVEDTDLSDTPLCIHSDGEATHNLSFIGLMEPLPDDNQLQEYKQKLGMTHASSHRNKQLWILWKEPILTLIQTIELPQVTLCQFNSAILKGPLWISAVYGRHTRSERAALWNAITSWTNDMIPWVIGGDFNCIHSMDQHKGSCNPCYQSVEDFRDCIEANNLLYIQPSGGHFSWSGTRSKGKVWRRLNHVFSNQQMVDSVNNLHLSMLSKGASDHRPLLLEFAVNSYNGPKPFRFLDMWVSHHTLEGTIRCFWENNKTFNGMSGLGQKLKALKSILTKWSKEEFGNDFHNLKEAESNAKRAQDSFEANPNPESLVEFNKANAELLLLSKRETEFWQQKSSIKWLKDGDASTKFFHNVVKNRRQKLHISSIKDELGRIYEGNNNIASHAITYYTNIYSPEPVCDDNLLFSYIPNLIGEADNNMICTIPFEEEIRGAVWDLNANSAPGPDGYNGTFFKTFWHIIRDEVVRATQEFFLGLPIPKSYGATLLTLIPKVENPKPLGDFRPISLSTFLSKINTKILANRLGCLLHKLISPEQSGFQAGKGVDENILLTQEMIHCLDNASGNANIAIKVDFSKAF
ncbi:unnamed protein product [Cuscuta campestris]|uniref:Reverse transcriptase domain-containing protein n=1 Tax=Cuscuta campestris TaxID=132261 RepID=A0A484KYG5_9ASTE|nr:unnamed protein product [Cuscuta campestris]